MNDQINAAFEFLGAFALLVSIRQVWRTRIVRGVHWGTPLFFWSWGLWNLVFYPSVGALWSTVAGVAAFAASTAWLALVLKYGRECK